MEWNVGDWFQVSGPCNFLDADTVVSVTETQVVGKRYRFSRKTGRIWGHSSQNASPLQEKTLIELRRRKQASRMMRLNYSEMDAVSLDVLYVTAKNLGLIKGK